MSRPFDMVDVFGSEGVLCSGNPLAVVGDAEGLADPLLQQSARWLNLSETTFLYAPTHPEADYCVRIFTLERELPFAGHPTLGSCHSWLEAGGRPRSPDYIVQECGAGLVKIRRIDELLAFEAPPLLRSGAVETPDLQDAADFLRIDRNAIVEARWIDNGPGWMGILLRSAEEVLAVEPAGKYHRRIDVGLVGPHPAGTETAFELRALFTDHLYNVVEDPVTGSLNASVGQWLHATGRADAGYVAAQGTRLGRKGRAHISFDEDGGTWVAGRTQTMFTGSAAGLP